VHIAVRDAEQAGGDAFAGKLDGVGVGAGRFRDAARLDRDGLRLGGGD